MPFTAPCRAITNSLHLPNDDEIDGPFDVTFVK